MVKSGCITFVPNGGGQIEIVNNSNLVYNNDHDAVEKIKIVLNNSEIQREIRNKLLAHSQRFSIKKFEEAVKILVINFNST